MNNWIAIDGKPYQLKKGEDLDNLSGKEPLPITPEVLIECGFEACDEGVDVYCIDLPSEDDAYDKVELVISMQGEFWDETHAAIYVKESDVNTGTWLHIKADVKYLHQLQNFYFVHAGKELKSPFFSFSSN